MFAECNECHATVRTYADKQNWHRFYMRHFKKNGRQCPNSFHRANAPSPPPERKSTDAVSTIK